MIGYRSGWFSPGQMIYDLTEVSKMVNEFYSKRSVSLDDLTTVDNLLMGMIDHLIEYSLVQNDYSGGDDDDDNL